MLICFLFTHINCLWECTVHVASQPAMIYCGVVASDDCISSLRDYLQGWGSNPDLLSRPE